MKAVCIIISLRCAWLQRPDTAVKNAMVKSGTEFEAKMENVIRIEESIQQDHLSDPILFTFGGYLRRWRHSVQQLSRTTDHPE